MLPGIDEVAVVIHQTAKDHGFWDKDRNLGEMLMLAVSECAEALEEDRDGNPLVYWKCPECGYQTAEKPHPFMDAHYIPMNGGVIARALRALGGGSVTCDYNRELKPEGALVEVIDALIRLLDTSQDMASRTRYTVYDVMDMKMRYNAQREHMHGKAY